MISLSDLDDMDIRDAKKGAFYQNDPHRMLPGRSLGVCPEECERRSALENA